MFVFQEEKDSTTVNGFYILLDRESIVADPPKIRQNYASSYPATKRFH